NSIPAGYAGFAIYKTNNCVPSAADLSTKFTPLAKFGSSYHPCVDPGDYLIQVTADSNVKGPLYIQLDVYNSSGAQYDHPRDAFDFGTINNSTQYSDFYVECQSIDDAFETCPALANSKSYTKSTWHT